jgi:hypothetical protein
MSVEADVDAEIRVIAAMRRAGASIRTIARMRGYSKSQMARMLPYIEQLASQMGQRETETPQPAAIPDDDLSQMGQIDMPE